jgi:hypothetical protein
LCPYTLLYSSFLVNQLTSGDPTSNNNYYNYALLQYTNELTVLRIRILLGHLDPDPDPLVRGMDPDPDPEPSL